MYLTWLYDVTVLYVFDMFTQCHSVVCIWCGYDVILMYVFDVIICCHSDVCIECVYSMSQCCMYLMWLCGVTVLYVFDVVTWSYDDVTMLYLFCHGYNIVVLQVFDVVIRYYTAVCTWCDYRMSQCCMCLMWLCSVTVLYVIDVNMLLLLLLLLLLANLYSAPNTPLTSSVYMMWLFDVTILCVFVVIWCHSMVCIWRLHTMSKYCIYFVWLCDITVLCILHLVLMS